METSTSNGFVDLLIKSGVLGKDQAVDADNLARQTNISLAQALVKLGYATDSEVMRSLARFHRMEYVDLETAQIPENVIELMPESVARENVVLPLEVADGRLKVLMSDPADVDTIEKLRFILNRDVAPALAPRSSILEAINRMYGQVEGESADSILQEFTDTAIDFTETVDDAEASTDEAIDEIAPRSFDCPIDDYRSGAVACFRYPRRAFRGSGTDPLPD